MSLSSITNCFREAYEGWSRDNAFKMSAALSYYTLFSLSPLLVIVVSIAGMVYGAEAARGELQHQLEGVVGPQPAEAIQFILASSPTTSSNILATIVGVVVLVVGATGVFVELRGALNQIWKVELPQTSGIISYLRNRAASFVFLMSVGMLLLLALFLNGAIAVVAEYMKFLIPLSPAALEWAGWSLSFGLMIVLFASVFKLLPAANVPWLDAVVGALLTALLFAVGKYVIGLYLLKSSVTSLFGAAASVIVILVWAYYSYLILIYGAEFTRAFAERRGTLTPSGRVKAA